MVKAAKRKAKTPHVFWFLEQNLIFASTFEDETLHVCWNGVQNIPDIGWSANPEQRRCLCRITFTNIYMNVAHIC